MEGAIIAAGVYLLIGLNLVKETGRPASGAEWFGAALVALFWPALLIWALASRTVDLLR